MTKYKVMIEEIISQEFEIEAENIDEASVLAERKYKNGEFVLDNGNLIGISFCVENGGWISIF